MTWLDLRSRVVRDGRRDAGRRGRDGPVAQVGSCREGHIAPMAWNVVIAGGGFGGFYAARTLARARCRRTARASRSSTTSTSCSTRRCCPGAAAGTLEPRHVVVPLREQLPTRVDLRLGHGSPAPTRAQRAAGRERSRATIEELALRPAHRRRRLGQPHAADPRAWPSTRSGSSRCPRRSRCATTSCARSRSPRRSRTARRGASTSPTSSSAPATPGSRGSPSCRTSSPTSSTSTRAAALTGMRWILVEAGRRVMPEIPPKLAEFASASCAAAASRSARARRSSASRRRPRLRCPTARSVPTRTLVWTAGVKPHPVVAKLGLPLDRPRADRESTRYMQVAGPRRRLGDRRLRRGPRPGAQGRAVPADRAARDPPGPARRRATSPRRSARAGASAVHATRRRACSSTWAAARRSRDRLGITWSGTPAWILARTYHLARDARHRAAARGCSSTGTSGCCSAATPPSSAASGGPAARRRRARAVEPRCRRAPRAGRRGDAERSLALIGR